MKWPIVIVCTALAGCASSGVVSTGADTYMLAKRSSTGYASGGEITVELYREAGAFCAEKGRQLVRLNTSDKDGIPGVALANSRIEFRCDPKTDLAR